MFTEPKLEANLGPTSRERWNKIQAFRLDEPGATFPFSARLAWENGWSLPLSHRVIDEYRRFIFLACEAGHPVTPSEMVDEVWHLHLVYTKSYWEDLCAQTLGQPLHHNPTQGGPDEHAKFEDWYAKTLESYRRLFDEDPPADIWPAPDSRMKSKIPWKVDQSRYWIIQKPFKHISK